MSQAILEHLYYEFKHNLKNFRAIDDIAAQELLQTIRQHIKENNTINYKEFLSDITEITNNLDQNHELKKITAKYNKNTLSHQDLDNLYNEVKSKVKISKAILASIIITPITAGTRFTFLIFCKLILIAIYLTSILLKLITYLAVYLLDKNIKNATYQSLQASFDNLISIIEKIFLCKNELFEQEENILLVYSSSIIYILSEELNIYNSIYKKYIKILEIDAQNIATNTGCKKIQTDCNIRK